jgi:ubiquinone/menaquinone biosynthesis C-methylase UbiE
VEPKLQRRVQRYGWDRAAGDYEALWRDQLAPAHSELLERAALRPGERVLDAACGTGLISFAASSAVGPDGGVLGVDISGQMIELAVEIAAKERATNTGFLRMDAETLDLPDAGFDVALCALGLMYLPDPEQAVREMRRVLRPGGRVALAVWGERARCGWAEAFPIVDAEVASKVCPLFFRLGQGEVLARACAEAGFQGIEARRITTRLDFIDGDEACDAVFVGGPAALAWTHFDPPTRDRVKRRYLESIEAYCDGGRYAVPADFLIVTARAPDCGSRGQRQSGKE